MLKTYTLLVAHGSRDERWKQPFEALQHTLLQSLPPEAFGLCYMEMTTPTYQDILETLPVKTIESLQILPLFMAAGAHVAHEIEDMKNDIQGRYPHLAVSVMPPIGEHPAVQEAFLSVIQSVIQVDSKGV
jgi:sirohydrochlorin cobaltochelatase